MSEPSGNAGLAFAVTCMAGLSTGVGASVVFFPSLVKLASRKVLASGLAFSAGVMLYVSFVEILPKGLKYFHQIPGLNDGQAYSFGTAGFFAGVIILFIIDKFIHLCLGHKHHQHDQETESMGSHWEGVDDDDDVSVPHCVCVHDVTPHEIDVWRIHAQKEIDRRKGSSSTGAMDSNDSDIEDGQVIEQASYDPSVDNNPPSQNRRASDVTGRKYLQKQADKHRLSHMGLTTALAITLHNFPEGLATFVATLADPHVGILLAIAIGIHNIPEGLCVALPIYYSTGSRIRGFLWGAASGLAEPFAALLGWLILAPYVNSTIYAILNVLVAGVMVAICSKELLPTAHKYDPKDSVASISFIVGMVVMGLSLIFFKLAG